VLRSDGSLIAAAVGMAQVPADVAVAALRAADGAPTATVEAADGSRWVCLPLHRAGEVLALVVGPFTSDTAIEHEFFDACAELLSDRGAAALPEEADLPGVSGRASV